MSTEAERAWQRARGGLAKLVEALEALEDAGGLAVVAERSEWTPDARRRVATLFDDVQGLIDRARESLYTGRTSLQSRPRTGPRSVTRRRAAPCERPDRPPDLGGTDA